MGDVIYKNEAEVYRNSNLIFTKANMKIIDKFVKPDFNYGCDSDEDFAEPIVEKEDDEKIDE